MRSIFTSGTRRLQLALMLVLASGLWLHGQTISPQEPVARHPDTFMVPRAEFDKVYSARAGDVFESTAPQLNKAKVLINTVNGDMQFIRLKLVGIARAYLVVQVNGAYSTKVFVLSDDHTITYKGTIGEKQVTFTKCDEDEIVSE